MVSGRETGSLVSGLWSTPICSWPPRVFGYIWMNVGHTIMLKSRLSSQNLHWNIMFKNATNNHECERENNVQKGHDVSFISRSRLVLSFAISAYKRCSVYLYVQLFVVGLMSNLPYLCLFTHSGVQHILCFVMCFCFIFLRLVYLVLPVSLDYPFLITPSVFPNVYL